MHMLATCLAQILINSRELHDLLLVPVNASGLCFHPTGNLTPQRGSQGSAHPNIEHMGPGLFHLASLCSIVKDHFRQCRTYGCS